MTHEQTTKIGRTARWLLLFGTLFGLAAMHTLGHSGMRMEPEPRPATVAFTGPAAVSAPCPDGHCPGDPGAMGGWSICVAVLGGLAVFALLAALLIARRGRHEPVPGEPASAAGTPRAPPIRPVGLILASTAVLRI